MNKTSRARHRSSGARTGIMLFLLALSPAPPTAASKQVPQLEPAKATLLILGTFHFRDAALDEYRPRHDVDILSERRQHEIAEVLDLLERFAPTKVAVEWRQSAQQFADDQYRLYLDGDLELPSNEVYQLGFRLAGRLGHAGVQLVDARKRDYEPWVEPDAYALMHGQKRALETSRYDEYHRISEFEDELKLRQTLREHLVYLNHPERLQVSHGIYLVGSFLAGGGHDYPGADSKTAWYNRNLRIFSNLLRIAEDGDRIVLIIGSGHVPLLRHMALTSPDIDLVEVHEVLEQPVREDALEQHLRQNAYRLMRDDDSFSGPGWNFLIGEAGKSQFVGIAEPHNTAELPHFVAQLTMKLSERKPQTLVLEEGPTTVKLLATAAERAGFEGVRKWVQRYPGATHFDTDQELDLIHHVATLGPLGAAGVAGIDRELIAAPSLDLLAETTEGNKVRTLSREVSTPADTIGIVSSTADFDRLAAALRPTDAAAAQVLQVLRSSHRALQSRDRASTVPGGGYLANLEREMLMRTNFMTAYRAAEELSGSPPSMVVKLGHWHLSRGYNSGGTLSVGSLLDGLATSHGSTLFSLNVQVINRSGEYWSLTDFPEYDPLSRLGNDAEWWVVDLRPARALLHAGKLHADPELREMIFNFDATLLIGGASAGTRDWQAPR